jgi:hypothetical membrane protein
LTLTGLAGPPLFVLGVILQQTYRAPAYSPISQDISALTAGGAGWAQRLNLIVFGLLVIAFAVGLHRGIAGQRAGVLGPALLGVNGLQLIIAGAFPTAQGGNGSVLFIGLGIAPIVLASRLRHDPRWRSLAGYVLGSGVALVVSVVLLETLARPAAAPLHAWEGSAQRLVVLMWLACLMTMALRLRTIAAAGQSGSPHDTAAWVRKLAIVTAVIIGLIGVIMFVGGKQGPGTHPQGTPAGRGATVSVTSGGGSR